MGFIIDVKPAKCRVVREIIIIIIIKHKTSQLPHKPWMDLRVTGGRRGCVSFPLPFDPAPCLLYKKAPPPLSTERHHQRSGDI